MYDIHIVIYKYFKISNFNDMRGRWEFVGKVHAKIPFFKDRGNVFGCSGKSQLEIRLGKKIVNSSQWSYTMYIK